jgi:hypothetical protein
MCAIAHFGFLRVPKFTYYVFDSDLPVATQFSLRRFSHLSVSLPVPDRHPADSTTAASSVHPSLSRVPKLRHYPLSTAEPIETSLASS